MRRFPAAALLAALVVLILAAAFAAPVLYWDGGLIEIESTQFVRQYLDGRGTLQKIFDPHGNDLDTYQARELSYLFDYLDARVFAAFMLADRAVFVPASAVLAAASTLLAVLLMCGPAGGAARVTIAMLVLVYVTNYVHLVTSGMLYRSAKPLLAPAVMASVFVIAHVVSRGSAVRGASVAVGVLFTVMGLLDRQGFYYAVAGTGFLVIAATRGAVAKSVAAAGIAAVVATLVYNLLIAPTLVQRINGYAPSFAYQQMPWKDVFSPGLVPPAVLLLLEALAALFGGIPALLFAALAAAVLIWLTVRKRLSSSVVVIVLFVLAVQIGLGALMIARHSPVYDYYDHRVWYYPFPFQALVIALLIVAVLRAAPAWTVKRAVLVNGVLAVLVVSNVLRWDDYRRAQFRSVWFPRMYLQNSALKDSFAAGEPKPGLSPEYRAFFDFWWERSPSLRARGQRGH